MSDGKKGVYANDCVVELCQWLVRGQLNSGQLASLRRANQNAKPPAFFWLTARIEQQLLERDIHPSEENHWSLLIHCLAILTPPGDSQYKDAANSPRNPHHKNTSLGQALFEAGFSELRLASLLDASGEQFVQKVARMARLLKSKQQKFNTEELALLIFNDSQESPLFESTRQSIARNYYRHAAKTSQTTDTAKEAS